MTTRHITTYTALVIGWLLAGQPLHAQTGLPDSTLGAAADSGAIVVTDSTDTTASRAKKADTLRYEADRIRYDIRQRILHLNGHAKTFYQNMQLHADTIIYRIDENMFIAHGSPRLIEGADTTVGEFMVYNTKTRRGRVRYATTHVSEGYFTGSQIVKSEENHLYIEDGDYTSCAYLDEPHFSFYGRNIKIIPGDKAISRPVVLNIGEAPVAALPYYIMPIDRGRRSGILTPGWGGNISSGGYVENVGYYWAPNDYMDFLGAMKVQEFESFVLNAQSRYALRYRLSGSLSGRYALNTNFRNQSSNWAVDYAHNQNLTPDNSFTLSGRGNLASSKTFYNAYSEDTTELLNQTIRANLALSKRFARLNASAGATWNRTHELQRGHISEDLPALSFSLPGRPLIPLKKNDVYDDESEKKDPPWYNSVYYSYNARAVVKHDKYDTVAYKETWRSGMTQGTSLSYNQKLLKYFNISPSFNVQLSNFHGFIDTSISRYDTLVDTVTYTVPFLYQDSRYRTYHGIDTQLVALDSGETADSVYRLTKISDPRSYAVYDTTEDGYRKDLSWNAGVSLSTTLYGMFPLRIFNFAGIRHTLTPSVSYNFRPEHRQDKRFFPIGIPYEQGHKRSQSVSFRIDNLFQGKTVRPSKEAEGKPQETKFNILSAGISSGYNFEGEKRKWSDLALSASTGFPWLRVSYGSSFWFYDENDALSYPLLRSYSVTLSPNSFEASGNIWDGDRLVLEKVNRANPVEYAGAGPQQWRLSLSPSYTYSKSRRSPADVFVPSKNYNLSASAALKFTRNWSVSWSSRYDFVKNEFVGHNLNFRCDLECWDLRFDWRPAGINPGYYFLVHIKKIPEIKWEERDR